MTFDEWWYKKGYNYGQEHNRANMEFAWNAATAAERQRCREIALNVGQGGISDQWFDCADHIACRIGE